MVYDRTFQKNRKGEEFREELPAPLRHSLRHSSGAGRVQSILLAVILFPTLTSQFFILTEMSHFLQRNHQLLPAVPQRSGWLGSELTVGQGHLGPVSQFCRQILIFKFLE